MQPNLFTSAAPRVAPQPRAMSLSQFSTMIGNAIRSVPALQGAWVAAELSDLRYSGGHCYMELIEKDARGVTVAKMRSNIWANRAAYIRDKFMRATGRELTSGLKVMLYGQATFHNQFGLSFNVGDIDPTYTLGDMERLRREIIERLLKEGVAANNRMLPPPVLPRRIAVISASGAAGYGDFINQLENNPDGFRIYPYLFEASMQGERTSASVRSALDRIEQTIDLWDCVVIIRGGGATTDLNGFDDYELARRVATFALPVVVGIGHERDRTVLDELACVRCKTPTAVAAWIIDTLRASWQKAASLTDGIMRYTSDRLAGERQRLSGLESLIPALASQRISRAQTLLHNVASQLPAIATARTAAARAWLDSRGELLRAASDARTRDASRRLGDLRDNISRLAADGLLGATHRLDTFAQVVDALSPANTLRRGYSVTRVDGRAVRDAAAVPPGTLLETTLHKGILLSETTADSTRK